MDVAVTGLHHMLTWHALFFLTGSVSTVLSGVDSTVPFRQIASWHKI